MTRVSKQWKRIIETNDTYNNLHLLSIDSSSLWDKHVEKIASLSTKPVNVTSLQYIINIHNWKLVLHFPLLCILIDDSTMQLGITILKYLSSIQYPNFQTSPREKITIFANILEILSLFGILSFTVLLSLKLSSFFISWKLIFLPLFIILILNTLFMWFPGLLKHKQSRQNALKFNIGQSV